MLDPCEVARTFAEEIKRVKSAVEVQEWDEETIKELSADRIRSLSEFDVAALVERQQQWIAEHHHGNLFESEPPLNLKDLCFRANALAVGDVTRVEYERAGFKLRQADLRATLTVRGAAPATATPAGDSLLILDGIYTSFSSAFPLVWVSSKAKINVVDAPYAVPFITGSVIECIALAVIVGTDAVVEYTKRASEAGAVGGLVVNTDDDLFEMDGDDDGFKSEIPVLMIKSTDAARFRTQR